MLAVRRDYLKLSKIVDFVRNQIWLDDDRVQLEKLFISDLK